MFPQRSPQLASTLVGNNIDNATAQVTHPIHHVVSTVSLTTIAPPVADLGYFGPVYLVADSVFSWTTSGNIGAAPGTTLTAGRAHGFIWDRSTSKWYPTGQIV